MSDLIEIAPGLWARPEQVMAVRTTRGRTQGTLEIRPAVTIHIPACELGWEFDDVDAAMAWAASVAATVNAALKKTADA